jgi:Zn-dependent peptidase ImmA (M78 family)/DNA-binding XRE family transcriptional regulator
MRPGTPGFVKERLTEAREARALTAAALAELVLVTRQAVHQYERGPQTPGHDVLTRLAAALAVPVHYFLKPMPSMESSTSFARSMSATTKTARIRAEKLLNRVAEMAQEIDAIAQLKSVNIPAVCEQVEDPTGLSMNEIEDAANGLRRAWDLGEGPISNVAWLLENHGIVVSRVSLEAKTLDGISRWINDRPFVLINDEVPLARARFDLLHELGHLTLHRRVPERLLKNKATFKLIEQQAHRFAGAFGFPQASFAREAAPLSLDRFLELKKRWNMSVKMMIHRADDLQIASSDVTEMLYRRYNWRGWTRREPLDDLPPEIPRMLDKAATLTIESGARSADDLLHGFALGEHEICHLACLRRPTLAPLQAKIVQFPAKLQ